MRISEDDWKAVVAYRIEKSQRTFKEGVDNAAMGNWSLAANRLYYAVFYMALAIIQSDGDTSKTHNGTFAIFSRKYISTGLLSKEEGSLYRQLFTMRQSGDYDDLFDWEEEDIKPLIPLVERLLIKMRSFVKD